MNSKKLKRRIADLEMLNLELLEAIQILSLKVDHLRDDIEDQNATKINPNQFIGWIAGSTSNSGTYYGTKTDTAL